MILIIAFKTVILRRYSSGGKFTFLLLKFIYYNFFTFIYLLRFLLKYFRRILRHENCHKCFFAKLKMTLIEIRFLKKVSCGYLLENRIGFDLKFKMFERFKLVSFHVIISTLWF